MKERPRGSRRRARPSAETPPGLRDLARLARQARRRAVAPFSRFKVGAAVRAKDGRIVTGCNVETASYGLTLCAERVAVFKAVSDGLRRFDAVAVVAGSRGPASPCGPCRQVLWELCGDVWVRLEDLRGRSRTLRLSELLPLPFDRRNL